MRRFSNIVLEINNPISPKRERQKANKKYFIKVKREMRRRFRAKYMVQYLYHTVKKADRAYLKDYQIPTLFDYYLICNVVKDKRFHFNSVLKDQKELNNEKEFLKASYKKDESEIMLKYALCHFQKNYHANLFPQSKALLSILDKNVELHASLNNFLNETQSKYNPTLSRIHHKNVEIEESLDGDMNIEVNHSRDLRSLIPSDDSSDKEIIMQSKTKLKKKNYNEKRGEINESTHSIENLIGKIIDFFEEKNRIVPVRKPPLRIPTKKGIKKDQKQKKLLITGLQENFEKINRRKLLLRSSTFKESYVKAKLSWRGKGNKSFKEPSEGDSNPSENVSDDEDFEKLSNEKNIMYYNFKSTGAFLVGQNEREKEKRNKQKLIKSMALTYNNFIQKKLQDESVRKAERISAKFSNKIIRLKTKIYSKETKDNSNSGVGYFNCSTHASQHVKKTKSAKLGKTIEVSRNLTSLKKRIPKFKPTTQKEKATKKNTIKKTILTRPIIYLPKLSSSYI